MKQRMLMLLILFVVCTGAVMAEDYPDWWYEFTGTPDYSFEGNIANSAPSDDWTLTDFPIERPSAIDLVSDSRTEVVFPNGSNPVYHKQIRFAIWKKPGTAWPNIFITAPNGCTPVQISGIQKPDDSNNRWVQRWTIIPQPSSERLVIAGGNGMKDIESIVLQTWCTPEPGSLMVLGSGLLTLAGMAVGRRRR